MQCNAMQSMQSMQCNTMHCKSCLAGVVGGACGGARREAFYAREMHDLHKCIQAIMLRNANLYPENTVRTRCGSSKIVPWDS